MFQTLKVKLSKVKILPLLLAIIIVILAVSILMSFSRIIFSSGGAASTEPLENNKGRAALLSGSVETAVKMSVRGRLVADENHNTYQIIISPESRSITTYKGYVPRKLDSVSLTNNNPAYEQFVYALDRLGFMNGKEFSGDQNDLRGACSTGNVFEFQVIKSGVPIKTLWTSTCKEYKGSLIANRDQVTSLIIGQIPDAIKLINKLVK